MPHQRPCDYWESKEATRALPTVADSAEKPRIADEEARFSSGIKDYDA